MAISASVPAAGAGTSIVTFNPGLVTQSIVQPETVKVDFRNLAWLGVVAADYRVCYGFGPTGVKTWDDMMGRKAFILGATGKSAGNYINGAVLRQVFNAPVRQILGFPGSAEQRIAIERGELDGDCGSISSIPFISSAHAWSWTGSVAPASETMRAHSTGRRRRQSPVVKVIKGRTNPARSCRPRRK